MTVPYSVPTTCIAGLVLSENVLLVAGANSMRLKHLRNSAINSYHSIISPLNESLIDYESEGRMFESSRVHQLSAKASEILFRHFCAGADLSFRRAVNYRLYC